LQEFDKAIKLSGLIADSYDSPGGGKVITFYRTNDTLLYIIYGHKGAIAGPRRADSDAWGERAL
jgi:hypothetical protein